MTEPERGRWRRYCLAAFVACAPLVAFAQLVFDVASIKENTSVSGGGTLQLMPGGGLRAVNIPVRSMITIAYSLNGYQLLDAPEWTRTAHYDLNARPSATATREQTLEMFRQLLVDRFKFAFHRESRQVDGFALVRVRHDALGPNLRRSSLDCETAFTSSPRCRDGSLTDTTLKANGAPVWNLVQVLIAHMRAPVSDDTGLSGTFDLDLRWSNDVSPADDLRPIDVAIQEQLGLKLERRKVTTDVVVVDRIERPAPD